MTESNQHYVSERLVDLFPVEAIRSLDMKTNPKTQFLFSKDMYSWSTYDTTNSTWVEKYNGDLRDVESQQAIDLILNTGVLASDILNMTQQEIEDFWKDEDYDPNMLAIAYATPTVDDFQFVNKFKMDADWKILKKVHENKEVYVKIYATHDTSILKNPITDYRIVPPTPQEGIPLSEAFGEYEQFSKDFSNTSLPTKPNTTYVTNTDFSTAKVLDLDKAIHTTEIYTQEYDLFILDDLDAFYSVNNLEDYKTESDTVLEIILNKTGNDVVELNNILTDSTQNLLELTDSVYNLYKHSVANDVIELNNTLTNSTQNLLELTDSVYNLYKRSVTNNVIELNNILTDSTQNLIELTDSFYKLYKRSVTNNVIELNNILTDSTQNLTIYSSSSYEIFIENLKT